MGLFDSIKNIVSSATGLDKLVDMDKLLQLAQTSVLDRAFKELTGMAEDVAKDKLKGIAGEEVTKHLDALLGDKASSVPNGVKEPVIDKTSDKVVDSSWDKIKERLFQSGE